MQHGNQRWAWIVFFASSAFNLLGQGWFAGLYGMGRVFAVRMLQTASLVLGFALVVGALLFGWGLQGMAWTSLRQSACTVAAASILLQQTMQAGPDRGKVDFSLIRGMFGPGLKYTATVLGGVLIL